MKRQLVTVKKCKHPRYSWRATFTQGGKYQQRYFTSQDDAKDFASEKEVELLNEGRKHAEFTSEERRAVIRARDLSERFEEEGIREFNLEAALDFFADHLAQRKRSATVLAAYDEFTETRRKEGASRHHLRDFDYKLKPFAENFRDRFVSDITTPEIDDWLFSKKVAAQTRLNHRRILGNFFGYCLDRGYCGENPVARAAKVKVPGKTPGILTVKQAKDLLGSCSSAILPAMAISLFAGLRRAEIERLDWSAIDLERGFINVGVGISKTARRRLVEISDNLKLWLEPHRKASGPVRPGEYDFRKDFEAAKDAAKIENWPNNAGRHSFATYHLAKGEDAAATALQLGHSDTRVLFEHYRELATPKQGMAFFSITPKMKKPKNVVSFSEEGAA